jgi:hypothetical protein
MRGLIRLVLRQEGDGVRASSCDLAWVPSSPTVRVCSVVVVVVVIVPLRFGVWLDGR